MKPEEGGDDVKSSWPLCVGLHTYYNGRYKGKRKPRGSAKLRKTDRSPDRSLQLDSVKLGIASNRGSECRGEYVPGPCTHRPSHHGSGLHQK